MAVEPGASLFRDLVFGLTAGWFEEAVGGLPVGRLEDIEGWQRTLSAHGLVKVEVERAASANGDDLLLTAEAPVRPGPAPAQSFAFVIGSDDEFAAETASSLATLLVAGGVHVSIILDSETSLMELEKETPDTVVFLAGAFTRGGEAAERLRDRCLSLKRCTEHLGARQTKLWVVAPGATRDRGGQTTNIEAGVWAFSRTLANEAPNLDVRRIDLSPEMSSKRASERLRDLILSGTPETEIVLDDERTQVVRFHAGRPQHRDPADAVPAEAARLERSNTGGLSEMVWGPAERRTPGKGEMEIAVEATGLNFRDVLWALSMLPEEILEDGFAGPRLGLECAGRVTAVGPGVKGFKVGDPVVAFAQSGFATHIVVPDLVVAPMPARPRPDGGRHRAGGLPHRLLQPRLLRPDAARRVGAGPWRRGRRRPCGPADRQAEGRTGHRHGGLPREAGSGEGAGRRARARFPLAGLRGRGPGDHRRRRRHRAEQPVRRGDGALAQRAAALRPLRRAGQARLRRQHPYRPASRSGGTSATSASTSIR